MIKMYKKRSSKPALKATNVEDNTKMVVPVEN